MATSELLLGTVPVAASIATLLISQTHSRRVGAEERADRAEHATRDRAFQSRENRYVDRRDAVIDIIAAAEDEIERIESFEMDPSYGGISPGDLHEDYRFSALNAAYAKLVILAEPSVSEAALRLRDTVYDRFHGKKDAWVAYAVALERFQATARAMLTADDHRGLD